MTPKVTVYIPVHNYGRFVRQAIQSVLAQKYDEWELIVINDGSTDDTQAVLDTFREHPKIRVVHQQRKGLPVSNNVALRLARGEYIMRLDADDYLDENALVVLVNILETHPEIGLVYPDYYLVNEAGEVLELIRRRKISEEVGLLDAPANGACTMIRTSHLRVLGGYSEDNDCQDGYDLWIRFVQAYAVYNVNLPLFYYRRHGANLTENLPRLLAARRRISHKHLQQRFQGKEWPRVLAIVPVRKTDEDACDAPLAPLAGKPLLAYTLEAARATELIDRIVVTSDDPEVLAYASETPSVTPIARPKSLTRVNSRIEPTVQHVLQTLEDKDGYRPDAVALLYVNAPLRTAAHIEQAIHVLLVFETDSVISVCEDLDMHYTHGEHGLAPLQPKRQLRLERDALFEETGAIYISKRQVITAHDFLGKRLGHISMSKEDSVQIDTPHERWLVEQLLMKRRAVDAYRPA